MNQGIILFLFSYLILGCGGVSSSYTSTSTEDIPQQTRPSYDVLFAIEPQKNRTSISPYIYGTNTESEVRSGVKMYRMGGNKFITLFCVGVL